MRVLFLILIFYTCTSAQQGIQHITEFGGVDTYYDSSYIQDKDAQDAMNVLTDEGDLRTIYGNTLYATVGTSTITFLKEWINSSGQRVLFTQSGLSLYATDPTSGTISNIATFSSYHDLDMVGAFNKAYFTDGTAYPFYSVGTTTTAATNMPDCKYVEQYQTRLACVNTTTETSKVVLSWYNDPSSWTVTSSVDSGAVKYFLKDDGEGINCVKATPEGLFVGKDHSVGLLKGNDNETFYWYYISNDIGCIDDRTVELVDGELVWLSKNGFYAHDFSGVPRLISLKVKPYTDKIRKAQSSDLTWTINSRVGWEAGTSTGTAWDYAYAPGSIKAQLYDSGVLTQGATYWPYTLADSYIGFDTADPAISSDTWSPNFIQTHFYGLQLGGDEFYGGNCDANPLVSAGYTVDSTSTIYGNFLAMSSSVYTTPALRDIAYHSTASYELLNDADLILVSSGILPWTAYISVKATPVPNPVGKYELTVASTDIAGTGLIRIRLTTRAGNKYLSPAYGRENGFKVFYAIMLSTEYDHCAPTIYDPVAVVSTSARMEEWFDVPTYPSYTKVYTAQVPKYSQVQDSKITVAHPYTFDLNGSSIGFHFAHSADSVTWSTETVIVNATSFASTSTFNRYYRYAILFSSGTSVVISSFTDVRFQTVSTATYLSPVKLTAIDISAWKLFSVSDEIGGTPAIYSIRGATYAFTITGDTPAWTVQSKNATIAIATNPYVQVSINPNAAGSTDSVKINSISLGYTVGTVAPRLASGTNDHRYIVSMSTNSSNYNDLTLIWQKNKEWTTSDQTYGALASFNSKIIAGSTTTVSKLWYIMDPTAKSFEGNPINAWWVTKDYTFGVLNNHKVLDNMWINADNSGAQTFTVGWQRNRNGTYVSSDTALTDSTFVVRPLNGLFLNVVPLGRQFRFKFSDNELEKYFRLKAYSIYYRVNPLIKD